MAGTLVLDTLQNGAGTASTSADNVINGSAKAWVNFNGIPTVAIRASYNVSSITRNGTGDYTVNFTNAFADANYSVTAIPTLSPGNGTTIPSFAYGIAAAAEVAPTASAFRFSTVIGVSSYDNKYNCLAVFR